jgi:hypothetical protein
MHRENKRRAIPSKANSPPPSGSNASSVVPPKIAKRGVKIIEPQAAQPTPIIPLKVPKKPTVRPADLIPLVLIRKEKTIIATLTPSKITVSTVVAAEKRVKLVAIEPKRIKGSSVRSLKDSPQRILRKTRPRLGSQVAKAKPNTLTAKAKRIYFPFRKTFVKAFKTTIALIAF